jgi:hypothetical protein
MSVTLRAEPCALQEIRTEWDIIYLFLYIYIYILISEQSDGEDM